MALFFKYYPQSEAFDTETYKGNVKLLCSSKSCIEPDENNDMIDWLYRNALDLNFFYNLSYDMSAILKPYITKDNAEEIRQGKHIEIGNYIISYIQGKSFNIQHKTNKATKHFYDIAQFYT